MYGKKRNERPNIGGVSVRSRNGAPLRKGCVVNGQMTASNNKYTPRCPQAKQKRVEHTLWENMKCTRRNGVCWRKR